jgi:uncharacterized protein
MLDLPDAYLTQLRGVFAEHAPEYEVLAYGSRVSGKGHATSDLDLVVRHPRHPERECAAMPVLREALRESDLPVLVEVLDWANIPETFRQEIACAHARIFPA